MPIFGKPKFTSITPKGKKDPLNDTISDDWFKCKGCSSMLDKRELVNYFNLCPKCAFHFPMTAYQRIELLTDKGSFKETDADMVSKNILGFEGYDETLAKKKKSTQLNDAVVCGFGKLDKQKFGIAVMDFRFMGASMGSVVGEKITRLIEAATEKGVPVLLVTASGGARMQEGSLSLMQMAKTSAALARHSDAGLAMFCLLTNPTYGGVTASYASLGDVILAEPGAMIGFAGARVIEATIKAELPDDFQTSEFLEKHGLVDRIVNRRELRQELSLLLEFFSKAEKAGSSTVAES
ncbi:MAG: acetyl-CoA carboxylase, carboxyltransferase subunit beta [Lentisphaeraceae bacterium]|nr:acetyl-CoA carboxylase, carboxyltransferase subunit beta [Lentisphaeraceae bacterium]